MYTFNAHFPKMVNERKCIKLKKLFYIGALSALLLTACGEDATPAKDVTPKAESAKVKEEKSPVEKAVSSVVKSDFEIKENEGIVTINIKDKKIHEGSKNQILKNSAKIFANLSKVDGIISPAIYWYAPLTDQYGNEEMGEVLAIMMDGETFKKVNWDNYDKLDLEAIAPGYKQHEALKD